MPEPTALPEAPPPPPSAYLVLDIETVPDAELYTPPEPPPATDRPPPPAPFPPLYACRPVLLGALWLDGDLAFEKMGFVGDGLDEVGMLEELSRLLAARRTQLVTWNGRSFDLPVLALRALRHGVPLPWYYQDPAVRHRYSQEGHLDLCDYLADHGAARPTSLAGAARLMGMPGKDGVDGSQVEALYQAGQMDALREYCLGDVAQTAFLLLRVRLLSGQLDREAYRRRAAALLAGIEADGRLPRLAAALDRARVLLSPPHQGG